MYEDFLKKPHEEWREIIVESLKSMDQKYLEDLLSNKDWLPGVENLLAAFTLPLSKTKYILLGESPYPRAESANGYAFFDASVHELWSEKGMSKQVNRATSLRNFIKMLLFARGDLTNDLSHQAIIELDKNLYLQTLEQLFSNIMDHGFLLLNACLVFSKNNVLFHAKKWRVFMDSLFEHIAQQKPEIQLIVFGHIAKKITSPLAIGLEAEHPYNLSFITNEDVVNFFKPLDLLNAHTAR